MECDSTTNMEGHSNNTNWEKSYDFIVTTPGKALQNFLSISVERNTEFQDPSAIPFVRSRRQFYFPNNTYILMDYMGSISDLALANDTRFKQLYMTKMDYGRNGIEYSWSYDSSKQITKEFHYARLVPQDFTCRMPLRLIKTPTSKIRSVHGFVCYLETKITFNDGRIHSSSWAPVLIVEKNNVFRVYRRPDIRFEYGTAATNFFETRECFEAYE